VFGIQAGIQAGIQSFTNHLGTYNFTGNHLLLPWSSASLLKKRQKQKLPFFTGWAAWRLMQLSFSWITGSFLHIIWYILLTNS